MADSQFDIVCMMVEDRLELMDLDAAVAEVSKLLHRPEASIRHIIETHPSREAE